MCEPCDCNPAAAVGRRLWPALAGSLLLHALVAVLAQWLAMPGRRPPPSPAAALQAVLLPAPALAPTPLFAPAPEPVTASASARPPPRPAERPVERPARSGVRVDLATLASRQVAGRLLYPEEAVVRGLEGEAQVMLFLDAGGNAVAARLERSSGHAMLDEAAVAAARGVRGLPEGGEREVLLPVRFRLD